MTVLAALEVEAGGLADLERQLRRNHLVGETANAVGAEIFASHDPRFSRLPASTSIESACARYTSKIMSNRYPGRSPHVRDKSAAAMRLPARTTAMLPVSFTPQPFP